MSTTLLQTASRTRLLHVAGPFVVLAGALAVLYRMLHGYPWHRLGPDLAALGAGPVVLAAAATVASYLAMTGYDALALRGPGGDPGVFAREGFSAPVPPVWPWSAPRTTTC